MASDLIFLFLGPNWETTVIPFQFLIVSLFFRTGYKICDSMVRSLGAVYKRLWVQILYSAIVIVGAYVGKQWGINGVAVATSISIFLNYLVMLLLVKRLIQLDFKVFFHYLYPIFLLNAVMAALIYLVLVLMPSIEHAFFRLAVVTTVLAVLYAIGLRIYFSRAMPESFKDFMNTVIKTTIQKAKFKK
jgi:PST family polysaccharide transporter